MAENNDTIVRYYHNHSIDCTCLTNVCLKGSFDQVILVIKKKKNTDCDIEKSFK